MYDPVELHATVDAWWHGVARAMRAEGIQGVPDKLDRSLSLDALWSAPDLLLTQTCGYPLIGAWSRQLRYLATPRYAAAGCKGATRRSLYARPEAGLETSKSPYSNPPAGGRGSPIPSVSRR